ncbi:NUDIX domain-containing protein [Clostridium oryzae]|uniref:Nudix hydrolase domain-containing protein n=1 Tax=Clostridium oryzae TaxID=1450648 RepID=A0A1V4I9F6_9CLOT|nr:NUDIX domain-containing protein [Clostridium oryzae]OPJ56638.1 hypothetical protein CLORY_42410 [Clostridium oryzae]
MDGKLRNMASLYLSYGEKILFLYRIGSRVVNNSYVGSAGGHFEQEELNDAKSCVLRELNEETGLSKEDIKDLALRYVTLRLKDNEIRQNYYFFADLIDIDKEISSNEGRLEWVDCKNVSSLDMPFTAKYVIEHFLKVGRNTACLYSGIATVDGVDFIEMKNF